MAEPIDGLWEVRVTVPARMLIEAASREDALRIAESLLPRAEPPELDITTTDGGVLLLDMAQAQIARAVQADASTLTAEDLESLPWTDSLDESTVGEIVARSRRRP